VSQRLDPTATPLLHRYERLLHREAVEGVKGSINHAVAVLYSLVEQHGTQIAIEPAQQSDP
jgi:hypothetical protein